jgi:fatty-acid desaturase
MKLISFQPNPKLNPLLFVLYTAVLVFGIWTFGASAWWFVTYVLLFWIVAFGIGFGFHRTFTHQAVNAYALPLRAAALVGLFANVGSPTSWKRQHELQHESKHRGFVAVEAESEDGFLLFLHNSYYLILAALAIAAFLTLTLEAFYFLILAPSALAFLSLNISSFMSRRQWGYRNFADGNNAYNLLWTWLLLFGENWHNNHHQFPDSPTTKIRKWELDPVWVFCFLFDRSTWLKLRFNIRKLKLRFQAKPKDYIY